MLDMITPAKFEDEMKRYLETVKNATVSEDKKVEQAYENAVKLMVDALIPLGFKKGIDLYEELIKERHDHYEDVFYALP